MARDSFSAGQGFVSWTVTPSLSLGEDQVVKVNANSATGDGAVVAFHLDHCPHPAQQPMFAIESFRSLAAQTARFASLCLLKLLQTTVNAFVCIGHCLTNDF
jgi:hypothetical protein